MSYIFKKLFVSCSQVLEIFFLPAVPTEHLDRIRQPQFLMTLHTVSSSILGYWLALIQIRYVPKYKFF